MKLNIYLRLLFIITIALFVSCKSDLKDESESFCSTDSEGSCSIHSKKSDYKPFQGVQNLFMSIYLRYANKIKEITKNKDEIRNNEFSIPKDSGIEKINSNNYQKLINGTWLIQIYSPWCPYSLNFQRTWRNVIRDVKTINKFKLENEDIEIKNKEYKKNDKNSKDKSDDKSEELKNKKRFIMENLKFAVIDADESIDVAALFEVKGFPTIKMIHKGNVVTYTNSTSRDRLVKFATEDWMEQEWYNRLPKTPSKLYQLQIRFSLFLYKIMYYLDTSIFVPLKYLTFGLSIYLAYTINILGKIRYGIIHVRQYFSAFVPEILELE